MEQTLDELLNEVNGYVQESQNNDYFVVGDSPAQDGATANETVTDEQDTLTADDVQQIVNDALETKQSDNADLASLVISIHVLHVEDDSKNREKSLFAFI